MRGLGALQGPFEASLSDAKVLLPRRLLLCITFALVTLPVARFAASYTHNLRTVAWIGTPGTWAIGFLYYADAMRLVFVPEYKLSFSSILRLLGVTIILLGVVILGWVGFVEAIMRLHLNRSTLDLLSNVIYVGLLIYFGTKFVFAPFALRDRGVFDACGLSWMLTTGATFGPTLVVMGAFYVIAFSVNPAVWALKLGLGAWSYATLNIAVAYLCAMLLGAFYYPFAARWMVKCEALKGTAAIVPPYTSS